MKVNVYDFDYTIYDGDSSLDFYIFCMKKNKVLFFNLFKFLLYYFLFFLKLKSKEQVKEVFFFFLIKVDCESFVDEFFEKNKFKIKKFYLDKDHSNDIIISASPYFLLKRFADYLGVKDLIASDVDCNTGKFIGSNCKGSVKVKLLLEKYPSVENFYTDSLSDLPLIKISKNSFIVKKEEIKKYDF